MHPHRQNPRILRELLWMLIELKRMLIKLLWMLINEQNQKKQLKLLHSRPHKLKLVTSQLNKVSLRNGLRMVRLILRTLNKLINLRGWQIKWLIKNFRHRLRTSKMQTKFLLKKQKAALKLLNFKHSLIMEWKCLQMRTTRIHGTQIFLMTPQQWRTLTQF